MEELTAAFCGGFQVSMEPNSTASPHPRFSMYKMKSEISNQEKRRNEILQLQKEKRFDVMKHVRCLTDDNWDDAEDFEAEEEEVMEVEVRLRNPGRHYKNQLMFSEWMLEVPESFAENWLMVPCPVGRRNLVVASRGSTKAFAKNGRLVNTFQSMLPGGTRRVPQWKSETTILDCIYDEASQTYHVLDMMCWRKTPIYDSETEFRFFWLQTKFAEEMETKTEVSGNLSRYHFKALPSFPCHTESIRKVFNEPLNIELDGILFYHKRAHYTFGSTPLVVWLKAYMLPEILGVAVPEGFLAQTPSTYGNFKQHSEAVRQKQMETRLQEQKKKNSEESQLNGYSHHAAMEGEQTDDQLAVNCQQTENQSMAQNIGSDMQILHADARSNCDM